MKDTSSYIYIIYIYNIFFCFSYDKYHKISINISFYIFITFQYNFLHIIYFIIN